MTRIEYSNLEFGVITFKEKKKSFDIFANFRTSTPRTVGIELDMEKRKIYFYLNGKLMAQKTASIGEGKWYPAITITGLDNQAILNPFSQKYNLPYPYNLVQPSNYKKDI